MLPKKILRAAISAAILLTSIGATPSGIPVVSVPSSQFYEMERNSQQVSNTGPLVGVQSRASQLNVEQPTVTVSGILPQDKIICIDIAHVSGVYVARAQVPSQGRTGVVSYQLPAELLAGISSDPAEYALLVRASAEDFCHARNDILLSSWGTSEPEGPAVVAVSATPNSTTRISLEGGARGLSCQTAQNYLGDDNMTFQRFSRVCTVSLGDTCRSTSSLEVLINETGRRLPIPSRSLRRTC